MARGRHLSKSGGWRESRFRAGNTGRQKGRHWAGNTGRQKGGHWAGNAGGAASEVGGRVPLPASLESSVCLLLRVPEPVASSLH